MSPKIQRIYDAAIKDKHFLSEIYNADGDKKPGVFADTIQKAAFAMVYYGYLIGINGSDEWDYDL